MTDRLAPHAEPAVDPAVDGNTPSPDDRLPVHGAPVAHPWRTVLRDQRKSCYVALGFVVASFWIIGQLGHWELAACVAVGVLAGLGNHLALEHWLLRMISSGRTATRGDMMQATVVRLLGLTALAVVAAVLLWPYGIGLIAGLAVFRLIVLMMTTMSLLKELKSVE